ncbi:hypothetical protein PS918_02761 [Pseudomonas fluorescens]|uniref:Uncharacterized protein n=1 Tax=Pseudomonas fluorescens TaxID=294 RepID=A0A5E7SH53_PSEFL|nr:hypothetical protein PS918_02761 [Pseudomonas fluorescens]
MTYVGAFVTSDIGPELLAVMSIHRPPRDTVKLCRLADGHCFSLNPSRVHVADNPCRAFEEHIREVVSKSRTLRNPLATVADKSRHFIDNLDEYITITSETSANYRYKPLVTYLIHLEYTRSYFGSYTSVDCWRHVCHTCELFGIAVPSLGLVRSRLDGASKQRWLTFINRNHI